MNKAFQTIIFILIFSNLYSQNDSINNFHLYTSPMQLIDFWSRPMITIGTEYILFNRIGVSAECGFKYMNIDEFDTVIINSKGYSYRFELKYYNINFLKKIKSNDHLKSFLNDILGIKDLKVFKDYISIEYRYIKDNYNSKFGYFRDTINYEKLTDSYAILKDIYIGNIKYGIIKEFGKIFYTDIYYGIGIRYRDIRNINREFNKNSGYYLLSPESFWTISDFKENSGLKFNISLGFKFGVRF